MQNREEAGKYLHGDIDCEIFLEEVYRVREKGDARYRFSSLVDRCVFAGSRYAEGVRICTGSDITPK